MVERAVARSPGHISGYFRSCDARDTASRGSIGGGIVVAEGVVVEAVRSTVTRVRVASCGPDGRGIESVGSPPVEYLMSRLGVVADLSTRSTLPIGAGFGLSAAALVASGTALSALYDLGLSRAQIAALAHEVEVRFRTGLGDVAAVQGGGTVVRRGPGVSGEILRIAIEEPVFAVSFGPISTPAVLGSETAMARVRAAFPEEEPRDLDELMRASRAFAEASGLVTARVRRALDACDEAGVPASMTMLGDGVFTVGRRAEEALAPLGRVFRLDVAREGFRLLEAGP
jgi:pantoate kinase